MQVKNKSLIWMLPALIVLAFSMPASAQDDLYYDPSTDSKPVPTYEQTYDEPNNAPRSESDDQYYEDDDYAYEYSSRIRRFHQPAPAMDYYDPMFVDLYHYDPYYSPGATIYTYGYNDYWAFRRWQAWQAYNPYNPWNPYAGYGYGYGPGWNVSIGFGAYSPWYNPFVWNNYYYDPYWTWNGYNPYYNSCGVNHGYYYYNNPPYYNNGGGGNNGYHPQTYVGPRRGGTAVGNGNDRNYARLTNGTGSNGRLAIADTKAPVIEMKARPTNTRDVVDKQKAMAGQQVDRAVSSDSRKPATPTAKDPNAVGGRTGEKSEKIRPSTETRPSRGEALPGDNVPANRPPATETRPSRQPSPQTSPARSQETRPARPSGGNEEARPSRPSSQDRPARSSGGSTETRPSRSSSDDGGSRTISPSSSGRSSGGDSGSSGRSSSGGSSSGGSSKSSGGGGGGGSRGRN